MTAAASRAGWPLGWLSRDGKTLLACRLLRTFGYGSLAVVLAIALEQRGLDPFRVGLVLTSALAGSAAITVFWSLVADRYGRRKTVATMALAMAAGGLRPPREAVRDRAAFRRRWRGGGRDSSTGRA